MGSLPGMCAVSPKIQMAQIPKTQLQKEWKSPHMGIGAATARKQMSLASRCHLPPLTPGAPGLPAFRPPPPPCFPDGHMTASERKRGMEKRPGPRGHPLGGRVWHKIKHASSGPRPPGFESWHCPYCVT